MKGDSKLCKGKWSKNDFIKEYYRVYNNPYLKILKKVMEILNKEVYIDFEDLEFDYDEEGLIRLKVRTQSGFEKTVYSKYMI